MPTTQLLCASVVIPTFNPSEILLDCLAAIYALRLPDQRGIELLVVDNNSSAEKHLFIKNSLTSFHSTRIKQRLIVEHQQGAGHARLRGIHLASCDFVGCLDDDNIPDRDWLTNGLQVLTLARRCGAVAGLLLPPSWAPATASFRNCYAFFALRADPDDRCFRYSCDTGSTPPSAGCIVRKTAVLTTITKYPPLLPGPSQHFPLAAEDVELFIRMAQCGWGVWHVPDLKCTHALNRSRLSKTSVRKLMRGIGLTHSVIRLIRTRNTIMWILTMPLIAFRDLLNWAMASVRQVSATDDAFSDAQRWRLFYAAQSSWRGNYHVLKLWLRRNQFSEHGNTWAEVDLNDKATPLL